MESYVTTVCWNEITFVITICERLSGVGLHFDRSSLLVALAVAAASPWLAEAQFLLQRCLRACVRASLLRIGQ